MMVKLPKLSQRINPAILNWVPKNLLHGLIETNSSFMIKNGKNCSFNSILEFHKLFSGIQLNHECPEFVRQAKI